LHSDTEEVPVNGFSRVAQAIGICCSFAFSLGAFGQSHEARKSQVVLLGTGTPLPDPERSGPSTAIVVNGHAYIVDFGTGIVRRAAAARNKGVASLEPVNLTTAFLTHLHSDHTLGFADLILTPWIMGRKRPLDVYGPPGTRSMAEYLLKAYEVDIKGRTQGLEHSNTTGYRVNVHEIGPGVVYEDENVKVTAFNARHGELAHTYGYRFDAPDRTIVISGDASAHGEVLANCHGCDVLIHEVYTQASFDKVSPEWKRYRLAYHTSTKELAEIATKAKPRLLVIYHRANPGCDQARTDDCRAAGSEEQALREIREWYKGAVVAGHDLDVY
jgi:ribonuclease BN (tRNA processing enzyme)